MFKKSVQSVWLTQTLKVFKSTNNMPTKKIQKRSLDILLMVMQMKEFNSAELIKCFRFWDKTLLWKTMSANKIPIVSNEIF